MHLADADHRLLIGPLPRVFLLARVGKLTENLIAHYLIYLLKDVYSVFVVFCATSLCSQFLATS